MIEIEGRQIIVRIAAGPALNSFMLGSRVRQRGAPRGGEGVGAVRIGTVGRTWSDVAGNYRVHRLCLPTPLQTDPKQTVLGRQRGDKNSLPSPHHPPPTPNHPNPSAKLTSAGSAPLNLVSYRLQSMVYQHSLSKIHLSVITKLEFWNVITPSAKTL